MLDRAPNQPVERMAAVGRRSRDRTPWAAAIAHFCRSLMKQGNCIKSITPRGRGDTCRWEVGCGTVHGCAEARRAVISVAVHESIHRKSPSGAASGTARPPCEPRGRCRPAGAWVTGLLRGGYIDAGPTGLPPDGRQAGGRTRTMKRSEPVRGTNGDAHTSLGMRTADSTGAGRLCASPCRSLMKQGTRMKSIAPRGLGDTCRWEVGRGTVHGCAEARRAVISVAVHEFLHRKSPSGAASETARPPSEPRGRCRPAGACATGLLRGGYTDAGPTGLPPGRALGRRTSTHDETQRTSRSRQRRPAYKSGYENRL